MNSRLMHELFLSYYTMFYNRKWLFVATLLSYGTSPVNVQAPMPYPAAPAFGGCPYPFCAPPLPPPPPQMIAVPHAVPVPVPHPVPVAVPFAIFQRPKTTTTTTTTAKPGGTSDEQEFVGIAISLPFVVPGMPAMPPPPACIKRPSAPSCPPCPPCTCVPCTPSFFSYCSPCHLECRCKNGNPNPEPIPPVPPPVPAMPLPAMGMPMMGMPPMMGPAPPPVFMVPFPPIRIKKRRKTEDDCEDGRKSRRRNRHKNFNVRRSDRRGHFRRDDERDESYIKPMLSYVARNGDVKFETKISNREADKLLRRADVSDDINDKLNKEQKDVQILTRTDGNKRQQIVILTNNKNSDSQEPVNRSFRKHGNRNKMLENGKKELVFTAPKNKQITNLSLSFRVVR